MASARHGHSDRRDYFKSIPFEDVYHDAGLGLGESLRKREVIQARQAEILIPDRLPLGPELRAVYCRSEAERATLLHGLTAQAQAAWGGLVRTGIDLMFFRLRPYVRQVNGRDGNLLTIEFTRSINQEQLLAFSFVGDSGRRYEAESTLPPNAGTMTYRLVNSEAGGVLTLHLEEVLAFEGYLTVSDLPF
jgi:hypothetical protein